MTTALVNGTVKERPAESGGVAVAVAALIARAFGVKDPDTLTYLIIVVGAVPALITGAIGIVRRARPRGGS